MLIRDLQSRTFVEVDPERMEARELLLYTVMCVDISCGEWRQFLIGDAIMAGIQLPEPKTLSDFAEGGEDLPE